MDLYKFGLDFLEKNAPLYKIEADDIGIITATDSNTFLGVKTLYHSIKDKVNFICYDLGMSHEELKWCKNNNLQTVKFNVTIPLIDKWQTYLKPFIIQQSPFDYTIWIDSDCIVTGNLSLSPLIQSKETFFTRHWINSKHLKQNSKELYESYPAEWDSDLINAGVLAINKTKDYTILEEWIKMVNRTIYDNILRNYVVNWDEGSLLWAIRKTNNAKKIIDEQCKYNFYCEIEGATKNLQQKYKNFYDRPIGNIENCLYPTAFFKEVLKQEAYICHFATCMENKNKYWNKWNRL